MSQAVGHRGPRELSRWWAELQAEPDTRRRWLIAGGGFAVAAIITAILDLATGRELYIALFASVVIAAWQLGTRAGIIVLCASILFGVLIMIAPDFSDGSRWTSLIIFAFAAGIVLALWDATLRARRDAEVQTRIAEEVAERARTERNAAEAARTRLAFLASATEALTGSWADQTRVLRDLAQLVVPTLGDMAVVYAGDGPGRRAVFAASGDVERALDELTRDYPADAGTDASQRVLRSGQPVVMNDITDDMIKAAAIDNRHLELMQRVGSRSLMIVPAVARGITVGVISLGSRAGRRYTRDDVDLAIEVARRSALVFDNARLYRQSQEALQRYRVMTDAMPQMVWTARPDGSIDYFNKRWYDYTGDAPDASLGWAWTRLVHPDDATRVVRAWNEALGKDELPPLECRLRRHDGEYRWHMVRALVSRDAAGRATSWLGTCTDMHDITIAQQQLADTSREREQLLADLRLALASKDEFLGLVSHELRTPITTIYGNAELLRRHGERLDADTRLTALVDIEQEAQRLQRIVDNLLALSRVESVQDVNTEPILAQRVVGKIVEAHLKQYPHRTINVITPPSLDVIMAEPTYFEQVFRNLLSNAEKYSPPDQPIDVVAEALPGEVSISVLDRGAGITPEEAEQVFAPFYRSASTAAIASGAGIGLAVCKRLVEVQGGRVWARQREGGGADVGFALPVEPDANDALADNDQLPESLATTAEVAG
jgi:PAS domain S-box-containing protein